MDLVADLSCDFSPADVFPYIDDLALYPQWMGLVHRATPIEPRAGRPAWDVELRARIGPFARSKRLTMVRRECIEPSSVVFERDDQDGRQHSMWRLSAILSAVSAVSAVSAPAPVAAPAPAPASPEPTADSGTHMEMGLYYSGGLWTGGIVERVLLDENNRSRKRLIALIADSKR